MNDLFQNINGKIVPRDICSRKHGGNPESEAAFEKISEHLTESQYRVLRAIKLFDNYGATVENLAGDLNTTPNAISGRITELRIKGKIKKNGTRKTRSGCSAAVWVAI